MGGMFRIRPRLVLWATRDCCRHNLYGRCTASDAWL